MILVCYHEEQDALRFYDCGLQCWEDMIYTHVFKSREMSLALLMEWGWEVIGEL